MDKYIKILLFFITLAIPSCGLFAQEINIEHDEKKINGKSISGFKSVVKGNTEDIINKWTKYLKAMGKYRARGNHSVVMNFSIDDVLLEDSTIYTTVTSDESTAMVWMGSNVKDTEEYNMTEYVKSSVYDFVREYYRGVVQKQIDEAERAVEITTRRHQRLIRDSIEYTNKLFSTKNEITRLEQLVEKNQLETIVLDEKLVVNGHQRDSILLEIDKMQKIVDEHKKRKNAIE